MRNKKASVERPKAVAIPATKITMAVPIQIGCLPAAVQMQRSPAKPNHASFIAIMRAKKMLRCRIITDL